MKETQMENEMNLALGNTDTRLRQPWVKPSLDHFSFKDATKVGGSLDGGSSPS